MTQIAFWTFTVGHRRLKFVACTSWIFYNSAFPLPSPQGFPLPPPPPQFPHQSRVPSPSLPGSISSPPPPSLPMNKQTVAVGREAVGTHGVFMSKNIFKNNNNHIQRHNLRFFTISSLHREPSPTCTLKWPGHNCVQITSSAYVQHVMLHATWYKRTAQLLTLTEFKSHSF